DNPILRERALSRHRRPELRLRQLSLEPLAHASRDVLDGAGIGGQIVRAYVERQHGAVAELSDPALVPFVQAVPIFDQRLTLLRAAARGDAIDDHVEWGMEVQQQARWPRCRRMQ